MGTTDKSDKPNKDQVEAVEATDVIEDAEVVEEGATEEILKEVTEPSQADDETVAEGADAAGDEPDAASESETLEADAEPEDAEPEQDADEVALSEDEVSQPEAEAERLEEAEPSAPAQEQLTEAEPPVASAPAQPAPRRGGFVPMVFGGAIAAAIGFGGAIYFEEQLGLGGNNEAALAELSAKLEAQNATLAALQNEAGSGAEAVASDLVALAIRLDDHLSQFSQLSDAVSGFDTRLAEIEKRPLNEGLGAAAVAAFERQTQELKDLVAAQKAEAAALKERADQSAKDALASSSVARIVAALESGAPYRAAIEDLNDAGGASVAPVLDQLADEGVVTLSALIESYPDAARAALAQARAEKVDDVEGNFLGDFFKNQLNVRSVQARDGTDTDAILSRAEAALKAGDLGTALGELDTLAEGPKSVMAEWAAQAQSRAEATQAAEDLAQTLNSN